VFLPLFTLQGVEGKTFRPLAYTVALAMLGSLLYAILVAPVLSLLVMRSRGRAGDGGDAREPLPVRLILWPYRPAIRCFVRWRALAVGLSLLLLLLGAAIFPLLGSEFTPELEEGTIVVRLTMAPSISLEQSKETTLL